MFNNYKSLNFLLTTNLRNSSSTTIIRNAKSISLKRVTKINSVDKINKINMMFNQNRFLFSSSQSDKTNNSSQTYQSIESIYEKLKTSSHVRIYDTKYDFSSEKAIVNASLAFIMVTGTALFIPNLNIIIKSLNFAFFITAMMIQIEHLMGRTKFIKYVDLLENNKVKLTFHTGKTEIVEINTLQKIVDDKRIPNSASFNHEMHIIFSSLKTKSAYHIPRNGIFLNSNLIDDITDGKTITI